MSVAAIPRLRARTTPLRDAAAAPLLDLVPPGVLPADLTCWLREGEGLVGWGRAAVCVTSGPDRFADAEAWWQRVVEAADVRDDVGLPGTGLLAFGSFSFDAGSTRGSVLIVPEVLVGRRDGRTWITRLGPVDEPRAADVRAAPRPAAGNGGRVPDPARALPDSDHRGTPAPAVNGAARPQGTQPPAPPVLTDGHVPEREWPAVVAAAVSRITAGDLEKVVLARDVVARSARPLDAGVVLQRLSARYCATWTFAVDGLLGATPEMLVRLQEGRVASRVLAGTVPRTRTPSPSVTETHPDLTPTHPSDPRLGLVSSAKELEEHTFAVRSVADALAPHLDDDLTVPDEPFVLELPDVYHLASDLTGTVRAGATSLRLAAALHPSAAVCGTPARVAGELIPRLERMDRGRYAGPVGWLDAAGDGDWGIALRCGQLDPDDPQPRTMRLFAGGGVVAASDPESELAETRIKLAAMRHALGADETA